MFNALDYYVPSSKNNNTNHSKKRVVSPPPANSSSSSSSSSSYSNQNSPARRHSSLEAARAAKYQQQTQQKQTQIHHEHHEHQQDEYLDCTSSAFKPEKMRGPISPMKDDNDNEQQNEDHQMYLNQYQSPSSSSSSQLHRHHHQEYQHQHEQQQHQEGQIEPSVIQNEPEHYFTSERIFTSANTNTAHVQQQQQQQQQQQKAQQTEAGRDSPLSFSPPATATTSAAPTTSSSCSNLEKLKQAIPFLSPGFSCTESDARTLLSFFVDMTASPHFSRASNNNHSPSSSSSSSFSAQVNAERMLKAQQALAAGSGSGSSATTNFIRQATSYQELDRISILEGQINTLTQRVERKDHDLEKLRDDVGEARSRYHALEQRFKNSTQQIAQRKEESRKQLICEENKVSKLNVKCKNLQMEVDRLRKLLHENLGTSSSSVKQHSRF